MECKIAGVHFSPYVGKHYIGSNRKIMFLGESHYHEDVGSEKTCRVIQEYVDGYNYRFFNGALRAVYGPGFDRKSICDEIAFYNYIQQIVGDSPRIRPTKQMWEKAKVPFLHVLKVLSPDIVICCGKTLYNHLPDSLEGKPQAGVSLTDGKPWLMRYNYVINKKEIPLYAMHHPSSAGFNAAAYNSVIKNELGNAKSM